MKINIAFWDTSALVPLCVRQDKSQEFRKLWRNCDRIIVWWGTTMEIRSAISRLHKEGLIDSQGLHHALTRLDKMREIWREINPTERVRRIAETLPDRYGLRALDSFQLAAALTWCNEKPHGRQFICDDKKLSEAALIAGFKVTN